MVVVRREGRLGAPVLGPARHGGGPRHGGLHGSSPGVAARSPRYLSDADRCNLSTPRFVNANAFTTRTRIKHVVFVVKENRTFDNLFGTFPGANGVTVGMDMGSRRPLIRGTDGRLPSDIPHCYRLRYRGVGQREDGRIRPTPDRQVGVLGLPPEPDTELLALGGTERPLRRLLLLGMGPCLRTTNTIAARSNEGRDNPRRLQLAPRSTRHRLFESRRPAPAEGREVRHGGERRARPSVLRHPDRGGRAQPGARPWAYYAATERQRGYIWSGELRDPPVSERSGALGQALLGPLVARRYRRR